MGTQAENHRTNRRRPLQALAVLALLVAVCLFAAGCGGGGSSSNSEGDPAKDNSAEFLQPGSANNKLVEFGSEAPASVRSEASDVLAENLEAREKADFATQCATLAKKPIEQVSNANGASASKKCAKELRKLAEPLSGSKPVRANQLTGPITALRLKGDQAYALYHGKDADDYAMPMRKEGTEWKVGAIIETKLGTADRATHSKAH